MSSHILKNNEAAAYLSKSPSWLNKSRMSGSGPTYLKLGGAVRYDLADLDKWLAGNRRTAVYDFANDNNKAAA